MEWLASDQTCVRMKEKATLEEENNRKGTMSTRIEKIHRDARSGRKVVAA